MPEALEIREYAKYLRKNLKEIRTATGRQIPTKFRQDLPLKVVKIGTHGKFLWIRGSAPGDGKMRGSAPSKHTKNSPTSNDWYILCRFGLSGSWLPRENAKPRLTFNDNVSFTGGFALPIITQNPELLKKELAKMGPDVFKIKLREFLTRFANVSRPKEKIVITLTDQSFIAGIGNYLSAEILWCARISPHRAISTVNPRELFKCMKRVLKRDSSPRVYGRDHDPDNKVIRKEKIAGRTRYWVPSRQK